MSGVHVVRHDQHADEYVLGSEQGEDRRNWSQGKNPGSEENRDRRYLQLPKAEAKPAQTLFIIRIVPPSGFGRGHQSHIKIPGTDFSFLSRPPRLSLCSDACPPGGCPEVLAVGAFKLDLQV